MRHGATPILAALLIGVAMSPRACRADPQPLPDSRLGIPTAPLLLLSRPDVRADIGLDPKQAEAAERAITELYARASSVKQMKGKQASVARREVNDAMLRWLQTWLTDAQRSRLEQVELQWEGPSVVIRREAVARALDLSQTQRETLRRLVDEHQRRRDQGPYQWSAEHELAQRVLSILSEPQRRRWKAMLGRPFTPQLAGAGTAPPRR
ncbi:MAG: hypothetical protein JO284_09475 [Planctomycetaceae bacterium]|nr:hypothetical protein [Planctomycetaceae bacterium]MBV8605882.1 hypothetical protein [Singulisphaera sp.]